MKDKDLKEVGKIIVCLGMSLFLGLALVYISEKYGCFVAFSNFVSLLIVVGHYNYKSVNSTKTTKQKIKNALTKSMYKSI